ncbi:MAG TPA: hypothetical protein VHD56_06340 [Tepidisphaeraceae bacterium]|nr:hypothetical protein [Tepidisphaeraceae bacterium]
MAKGKHSVALFEVIQTGKSTSKGISLRTPKWWFNSKKPAAAAPPVSPKEPDMISCDSSAPAPRVQGIDLKVDPDRQRIKFDVSYTSAIVAGFAVIVVITMAYVIGSRLAHGPSSAMAGPSTAQLRQGPAQPDVLNLGAAQPQKVPVPAPVPTAEKAIPIIPIPAAETPAPPQRTMGLNYVIVQGYPPEEKSMALNACELLKKNNVPCTVETNVPGYQGDWNIVIGLTGFERPRTDPAFTEYVKKISDLSDKFAGDKSSGNAKFKRFAPTARKWTGLNH